MKALVSFRIIAIAIGLLVQCSCSTRWHINRYSGDGVISEVRAPSLVRNGYTVEFPRVTLGPPVHETYQFKGLPNITGRAGAYFALDDPRYWRDKDYAEVYYRRYPNSASDYVVKDDLKGFITISLKDREDNVIFEVHEKLSNLIWRRHGQGPWMLYDRNFTMRFKANPITGYLLEVAIDSEPMLQGVQAYIVIESGLWRR